MQGSEVTPDPIMEKYDHEKEEEEGEMIMEKSSSSSSSSSCTASGGITSVDNIKPFIQGGGAGVMTVLGSYLWDVDYYTSQLRLNPTLSPARRATMQSNHCKSIKRFPTLMFQHFQITSARVGSFEILKRKVEAATNNGRPISVFQEAYCGMTAGAIGAIFGSPVYLATLRIEAKANLMASIYESYSKNLLLDLCHTTRDKGVLALWKGGGYYTAWSMALSMGMLVPYGRGVAYFKESLSFSDFTAGLSGSIVSGVAASSCSLPCLNTYHIMKEMRRDNSKDMYQRTGFLDCALNSVKLGGLKIFYKGFLGHLNRTAPHVMLTMICLGKIRNYEKLTTK